MKSTSQEVGGTHTNTETERAECQSRALEDQMGTLLLAISKGKCTAHMRAIWPATANKCFFFLFTMLL